MPKRQGAPPTFEFDIPGRECTLFPEASLPAESKSVTASSLRRAKWRLTRQLGASKGTSRWRRTPDGWSRRTPRGVIRVRDEHTTEENRAPAPRRARREDDDTAGDGEDKQQSLWDR